jgi:hypothetical protein
MVRLLVTVLAAACSSPPTPTRPARPPPQSPIDAPTVTIRSERECDDLVAHAIALHVAHVRATVPAAQHPSAEDITKLSSELTGEAECRALGADAYRCAMTARTLTELAACQ